MKKSGSQDLLTDLNRLDELSRLNWNDNWNFREFLLSLPDPQVIDRAVQQLNREVSAKIDCTQCGNCCRQIKPSLAKSDVTRLAQHLEMLPKTFEAQYIERDPTDGERVFCNTPCSFLGDAQGENRCRVYEARPLDCRSYPHLDEDDFLVISVSVIENYRVCPIVYNVYEQLKIKLGYDPANDYIGDKDILE